MDHLSSKTEDLEATSEHKKRPTHKKVARKFWWKNVKIDCLICVIVYIVLFIRAFATGAHPNPGTPPSLPSSSPPSVVHAKGALSPVLLHVECCSVLHPLRSEAPCLPQEHLGLQKERAGLYSCISGSSELVGDQRSLAHGWKTDGTEGGQWAIRPFKYP